MMNLLCKRNIVVKSKEVDSGCSNPQQWTNLAEFSKKGYGSKRAVLSIMMMMVMTYTISLLQLQLQIPIL
jgi:hypothetical protein